MPDNKPVESYTPSLLYKWSETLSFVAFLIAYFVWGIMTATWVLMGATAIAVAVLWHKERRVSPALLIAAITTGFFGILTVIFNDDSYIKMKFTYAPILVCSILLLGLRYNKAWMARIFPWVKLCYGVWRLVTIRLSIILIGSGVANEIMWRSFSTDIWMIYKTIAGVIITVLIMMFVYPLFRKKPANDDEA